MIRTNRTLALIFSLTLTTFTLAAKPEPTQVPASPAQFLERPLAADFELVDWTTVESFYQQLSKTAPTVQINEVGQSTEGRRFYSVVISSEANLANLAAIKAASKTIADPRGKSEEQLAKTVAEGKVVLMITPTMHSDEPAATEMGMELAWHLATSQEEPWKSMRSEAVTVILPSLNPDGIDHVAHWYKDNLGTPYEDSSLPELYQKYAGHDINRDFFALTQVESQLLSELMYDEWNPQILWDVHQQGSTRERFFVPPYKDPLNENIDPQIVAALNAIGNRAVLDMTRDGLTGIATGVSYDNWWNGGNRSVPARANIVGILTEAASVNYASPVFLKVSDLRDPLGRSEYRASNRFVAPWPGGWWRQADIVNYELSFARSLLGSIGREPKIWLETKLAAARQASTIDEQSKRQAWLITTDNEDIGAVQRLIDSLQQLGVELHTSESVLTADERSYAPGTIVVRCDQPHSRLVNDLFEWKLFPKGETPYDVSGWSLPTLFGLHVVEVIQPLEGELSLLKTGKLPEAFAEAHPQKDWTLRDSRQWTALNRHLVSEEPFQVALKDEKSIAANPPRLEPELANRVERMPRVGVYAPWRASIDEGWLRWTLDYFETPYQRVRNSMVRAGNLRADFDVILIPDIVSSIVEKGRSESSTAAAMAGGLDTDGAVALEEFVRDGGKLIVMESATPWAIDLFRLPLIDVTEEAKGFSCSGSVVRGEVQEHELTHGLNATIPFMFTHSKAWRETTSKESEELDAADYQVEPLLRYASRRVLLSGAMTKPEVIQGQMAWTRVQCGEGSIHLFGFRPYYRGWTHASFHLLMRAIMFD
ncbi:M14 family zinc carboxypeptidase [Bremerella cremea]|uniref:M14 family zinc carboxypeptidase n=1 Tax=Bremerella cremea TaxID=1031537 RepID=UPI0031F0EBFA